MGRVAAPERVGRWPDQLVDGWTVDVLEALPDDGLRYELLDGTLLVTPAPSLGHQFASGRLFLLLESARPADLVVLYAPVDWQPEATTSLQPDLLVVRRDQVRGRRLIEPPLLVVEVLSPSTATIDRTAKAARYAASGVDHFWIVDPRTPSIQVLVLREGRYQLVGAATGVEPLHVTEPMDVTVVPQALVDV